MRLERVTYFWCVPSDSDASRFQSVIDRLAGEQGAPRFIPHLSLASVQGAIPDLSSVLSELRGLRLTPLEIDQTDLFTMSLFLRVEARPALLKARKVFESLPGFRSSRKFDPHLSLCYGPPPQGAAQMSMVQELLRHPIQFDKLVTVDNPAAVRTYDDIRAWKILNTYPL